MDKIIVMFLISWGVGGLFLIYKICTKVIIPALKDLYK